MRALAVSCHDCLHNADVNVDAYPGHLAVQSFVRRMRCSKCGGHNISLMPAWHTNSMMRGCFCANACIKPT